MSTNAHLAAGKWVVLLFAAAVVCGCHRQGKTDLEPAEKRIIRVVSLYRDFKGAHNGHAPASTEELKSWTRSLKPDQLQAHGIDNVDDAFVSPRDNQPYVLVKTPPPTGRGGPPAMVVVHEKVGVNGKRMVGNAMGYAYELDDEELKKNVPNP
jgi:hypothetical protein